MAHAICRSDVNWMGTLLLGFFACSAIESSTSFAADVKVETVLTGLHRPCSVAIRPNGSKDKYELFIAESGAGRVLRWSNQDRGKATEVIAGFRATPARNLAHQTGPLALLFLDPGLLVVSGAAGDGVAMLQVYDLPDDGKALSANGTNAGRNGPFDAARSRGDIAAVSAMTRTHQNDVISDALVYIVQSGDQRASLCKSRVQAGVIGPSQQFSAVDLPARLEMPAAVATSGSGRIVVAFDRRLVFLNPLDGKVEMDLATDLSSPSGLAYSPTGGGLYAASFDGGIDRIDDAGESGKAACRTVKIAEISHPTGIAFAPDESLFVITLGTGESDGSLQVVTGSL